MVESKNLAETNMTHMPQRSHGLPSNSSLSLASYSTWFYVKLTPSWHIPMRLSRWTWAWSSIQLFTPSMGTPRTTSSSYLPTSTGKSKLARSWKITLPSSYKRSTLSNHSQATVSSILLMSSSHLGIIRLQLTSNITELQNIKFSNDDQGHPTDYVRVNIKKLNSIIPRSSNLHAHWNKHPFLLNFGYRFMIGKVDYLVLQLELLSSPLVYALGTP